LGFGLVPGGFAAPVRVEVVDEQDIFGLGGAENREFAEISKNSEKFRNVSDTV
jgi:hypothetical protein